MLTLLRRERMETMDLSCNTITTVKGLDRLASLNTLSLGEKGPTHNRSMLTPISQNRMPFLIWRSGPCLRCVS